MIDLWNDCRYHYLKNWDWSEIDSPKPHAGNGSLPVTYIGYAEAKAYCASLGKRLPTEVEWQYAGQGNKTCEGNMTCSRPGEPILYPWGEADDQSKRPKTTTGNVFGGPEPVDRYSPAGDSLFGLKGMVGNAYDMTDEFADGHTRSVILRGSANYRPAGSHWYLPLTPLFLGQHEKYFLMDDRYERAGTIGFRCAADLTAAESTRSCVPGSSGSTACGTFDAPAAFTDLTQTGVNDWVAYGLGAVPPVDLEDTVSCCIDTNNLHHSSISTVSSDRLLVCFSPSDGCCDGEV